MKVAMYTPMPPARTGVAHYASILIPELRKHVDLAVNPVTRQRGNPSIYQLGNNPSHEFAYAEAMRQPGVIVLHDIVLHPLTVRMTLARGDAEGYTEPMRANHGEMGAACARGRIIGLHDELANFLMPASIDVANRSRAVIVHNRYAADRLRSLGVRTPIYVVPHPYRASGLGPRASVKNVVGFFGFLTSAKRAEVVLEAFRLARRREPNLQLLVVGEAAPNIVVPRGEGIAVTGYVEDLDPYYDKVDRLVNLRYPSAGETSGTLIRAFDAGKPVAVSDYAQFAELPDDCVVKIPFGEDEVARLADFFLRDWPSPAAVQRQWLEENARIELTVEGYLKALSGAPVSSPARSIAGEDTGAPLSLFPNVSLEGNTLRNNGDTVLRAADYGQPGYRAIVNGRWIALPKDLYPGESTTIEVEGTLINALQGIPVVDEV